jgi:hypothetical protein
MIKIPTRLPHLDPYKRDITMENTMALHAPGRSVDEEDEVLEGGLIERMVEEIPNKFPLY